MQKICVLYVKKRDRLEKKYNIAGGGCGGKYEEYSSIGIVGR